MNTDRRLEQANDNSASFWLAQARVHGWQTRVRPGWTAVRGARTPDDVHRVVITRPYAEPGLVERELTELVAEWSTVSLAVEDLYGGLDLHPFGPGRVSVMPVMFREPGPAVDGAAEHGAAEHGAVVPPATSRTRDGSLLTVVEALDADTFAQVERVIVDGFPLPARQPWVRGDALPWRLLAEPGCRGWLGSIDGDPVGACLTYDDGLMTGVYWVATLPGRRGQGVGAAVTRAALAHAHPDRPATLVASTLGEPVYRKLGFTESARTCRWSLAVAGG
ncbi:GNAT family N-acetyltransferase [Streptomyces rubellomurinus]|uniref:GNAT family N-acetyltransferase n=1 Tax=Streptomyces rubellomurinus (strain ATCC 31215) TaxID=359131 RepID=UPI000698F79A|nr:GNAT family N-acetyltransferase [Streptomyces rubellomurinus]